MKKITLFVLLILIFRFSFSLAGEIEGKVISLHNSKPLPDVRIKLVEENRITFSDDSGKFVFRDVPKGLYRLVLQKETFQIATVSNVRVKREGITKLTVKMHRPAKDKEMFSRSYTNSYGKGKKASKIKKERGHAEPEAIIEYNGARKPSGGKKTAEMMAVSAPPSPQQSGLKAGYADDNRQFNYFLGFLEKYGKEVEHYPLKIKERIKLQIVDKDGKSIPNLGLKIFDGKKQISSPKTYADGSCYLYPNEMDWTANALDVRFTWKNKEESFSVKRDGPRIVSFRLPGQRKIKQPLPLDIQFILDTTGSMGEEIERLKQTIEIINMNLSSIKADLVIRYGMVLYRDKEDEYVSKRIPLTSDLEAFRKALQKVKADGGGDTPEDLQSALKTSLQETKWNRDGVRLAFIITDASTHLDYGEKFTYAHAARLAKQKAIKIFSIGTGGLAIDGEYILRQIAQFTGGKYIFLTYGEKGESEGGTVGSVSHHTGSNYQTDKLESIIIRFSKEELAHLVPLSLEEQEPYFQARRLDSEQKETTLKKLFSQAIQELQDFSTLAIKKNTTLSVMPLTVKRQSLANNAEYFTEQLLLALRKQAAFKLIERKDLQYITQEIGLQLSGVLKSEEVVKVGELLGAQMLLVGNMYFKDGNYELYLKLLRVSTAEVLSVTKLRIDPQLGL